MNGDMILTPDLAGFVANDQLGPAKHFHVEALLILELDAPSTSSAPPRGVKVITAASRKQNIACDACRAKKVRCQRTSVSERVSYPASGKGMR